MTGDPPKSSEDERPNPVPSEHRVAPSERPPSGNRSGTLFVWIFVIAALGGVWWWFGRAEPASPPPLSERPGSSNAALGGPAAVPTRADWAESVRQRGMAEVAARRSQAARRLIERQGLSSVADRRPDWKAGQLLQPTAPKDAGTTSR